MSVIINFIAGLWAALVEHLKKVLPEGVFDLISNVPMPIGGDEPEV
ncbi:MAG: hypothetical protein ACI4SB_04890 [Acutalibacteraceae bacterium]